MSTRTILIGRELSREGSKGGSQKIGQVLEVDNGDCSSKWGSMSAMNSIYYWKTCDLTDAQVEIIKQGIAPPEDPYAKSTRVMLVNVFSEDDKLILAKRGDLSGKDLGSTVIYDSFKTEEIP